MEDMDRELNTLWEKEGRDVVERGLADEKRKEQRLPEIRNAERVLLFFIGNGLADAMPLGDALGFLDVELEAKSPRMYPEEITRVRDFLTDAIDREWSVQTPVGEVVNKLRHEEQMY